MSLYYAYYKNAYDLGYDHMIGTQISPWHDSVFVQYNFDISLKGLTSDAYKWLCDNNIDFKKEFHIAVIYFKHKNDALKFKMVFG